ncbi:hypothetical protein MHPYR_750010 [uncultured Mycobacterium sp.]|uniref:Uncharacterized protein n=1 Tax=uncultured Mycobacterium sp. TaxID=171292 RepID=A0A1Y5PKV0_9MYCO|nr:hypothetical protein MHPYR_750010 [uncultured Mycobacterium sp.]
MSFFRRRVSAAVDARGLAIRVAPPKHQKKPWCPPLFWPGVAVWGGVTGLGAKLIDGGELTVGAAGFV